jgi:hypothetical protein
MVRAQSVVKAPNSGSKRGAVSRFSALLVLNLRSRRNLEKHTMKTIAFGVAVGVVLVGCGLGAGLPDSRGSSGNSLSSDSNPGSDPCEVESLAFKKCFASSPNDGCDAERKLFEQCLALNGPPDTTPPDACQPLMEKFKQCSVTDPGSACDDILASYTACEGSSSVQSPPPPKP